MEFDIRILAHMVDARAELESRVHAAEVQRIWTSSDGVLYRSRNTLLRNAAYEIQARARLQRLHFRAAEAILLVHGGDLDSFFAVLARHYRRADAPDNARQYYLPRRAPGDEALGPRRGQAHVPRLPQAHALTDAGEHRRPLRVRARRAGDRRRDLPRARGAQPGDRRGPEARRHQLEALGWLGLGRVRWLRGQLDEAQRCLEQGVALSRTARNRWTESRVLAHLALVYQSRDQPNEALAIFETAVSTGVALGVRDDATVLGGIVQHFAAEGHLDEAFALYRTAMDLRREV